MRVIGAEAAQRAIGAGRLLVRRIIPLLGASSLVVGAVGLTAGTASAATTGATPACTQGSGGLSCTLWENALAYADANDTSPDKPRLDVKLPGGTALTKGSSPAIFKSQCKGADYSITPYSNPIWAVAQVSGQTVYVPELYFASDSATGVEQQFGQQGLGSVGTCPGGGTGTAANANANAVTCSLTTSVFPRMNFPGTGDASAPASINANGQVTVTPATQGTSSNVTSVTFGFNPGCGEQSWVGGTLTSKATGRVGSAQFFYYYKSGTTVHRIAYGSNYYTDPGFAQASNYFGFQTGGTVGGPVSISDTEPAAPAPTTQNPGTLKVCTNQVGQNLVTTDTSNGVCYSFTIPATTQSIERELQATPPVYNGPNDSVSGSRGNTLNTVSQVGA